ncbi:1,4-dihydroxy-2-naphthoate octaprenyltransferase [Thermoflexales bacterium]|nr:1,4-dihydroxy-2-naphthoate octaprenyltransferase [Thermoflexales bacterium]
MGQKILAFVKLTRPWFLGGGVILYLLGAVMAQVQGFTLQVERLLLGQLLVTSIQLATHYSNEYYDYAVDAAIGSARTPFSGGSGILVSGQLERVVARHATYVCLGLAGLAWVICGLLSPLMWIIGLLAMWGGYFYSAPPLKLEGSGWGELVTALLTAVLVPLTGYIMQTNQIDPLVLISCLPLIPIYLAMVLTFELPDFPADRAFGKKTITVRVGVLRAAWLHNLLLIGGWVGMAITMAFLPPRLSGQLVWLALPLGLWQIAGVVWRSRRGWRSYTLLAGGAVALAGLIPLLWLIDLLS